MIPPTTSLRNVSPHHINNHHIAEAVGVLLQQVQVQLCLCLEALATYATLPATTAPHLVPLRGQVDVPAHGISIFLFHFLNISTALYIYASPDEDERTGDYQPHLTLAIKMLSGRGPCHTKIDR